MLVEVKALAMQKKPPIVTMEKTWQSHKVTIGGMSL